jgi:hypothetical protein
VDKKGGITNDYISVNYSCASYARDTCVCYTQQVPAFREQSATRARGHQMRWASRRAPEIAREGENKGKKVVKDGKIREKERGEWKERAQSVRNGKKTLSSGR